MRPVISVLMEFLLEQIVVFSDFVMPKTRSKRISGCCKCNPAFKSGVECPGELSLAIIILFL